MTKSTAWRKVAQLAMGIVAVAVLGQAVMAGIRPSTDASAGAVLQGFPIRPVVLVVTFPPGGGTDLLARRLAAKLERRFGQPVVVENRAGASGNIGAQVVARAKPDGYTLLVANSSYAINPGVFSELGFSPLNDLTGVINVAYVPSVVVTAADSNWQSLQQALQVPQQQTPDAAPTFASCGNGTPQHLAGEMLMQRSGVSWLHVPYRGCGPALTGVRAGTVDMAIVTASSAMPLIEAGVLRALAVTSPQRSSLLPDVPAVAELGFEGYELDQWHGLLAPAKTPKPIVARINAMVTAVMQEPETQRDLKALGYETTVSSPEEFQAIIENDIARFGALTTKIGLKAD
nr:tripartite tricarboxylate transporter substrate binding protein [Pusillimonas sp. ANT_WB101]